MPLLDRTWRGMSMGHDCANKDFIDCRCEEKRMLERERLHREVLREIKSGHRDKGQKTK